MPLRIRVTLLVIGLVAALPIAAAPGATPTLAAGEKVVIIVGPVGSMTTRYRSMADEVAATAASAGANVVKVYSPVATWANVKAAVNGANVIVYFGHGNGYPNPYGSNELTDRSNGWGLNTATTNEDEDSWAAGTLVYCGERALLGTLTAGDDAARRDWCGGTTNDGITPAPGFTMVYAQAHYAPGFGERYSETTPPTTLDDAQQRVRHYSYPVLALGGTFLATAYGDADDIVGRLLTRSGTSFGDIFRAGRGYSGATLTTASHPDVAGAQTWVQSTVISSFHYGDPDYWYAFAGDPVRTPAGSQAPLIGPFRDIGASAFINDIVWLAGSGITSGCAVERFCPTAGVTREQMASFLARGLGLPAVDVDPFDDDDSSPHEADINRLAAAGIVTGCGDRAYCPAGSVTREQMASFLARALALPATDADLFVDDNNSIHQSDINRLASSGVTSGCGGSNYCPSAGVTREQMAAFLHRALGD